MYAQTTYNKSTYSMVTAFGLQLHKQCWLTINISVWCHVAVQYHWTMLMVRSTNILCPQNLFRENRKDTKVIRPIMRTYNIICAFDTSTIFCNDVTKTSTSVKLLAINIPCYMSQRSNIIKSTSALKTFVEERNGRNALVCPLEFDELLSHFSSFL